MASIDYQDQGVGGNFPSVFVEGGSEEYYEDFRCDEDDEDDYLIHGGEYDLEDRPVEDDDLPEFDD